MRSHTPPLETDRLLLRRFTLADLPAILRIFGDEEVNTYLPWYPVQSMDEARLFYEERYASFYQKGWLYRYAICLKEDDEPIGYVNVGVDEAHDLGYGLRREFQHQGIVTEAARRVLHQVEADGLPFVTATHDVQNMQSGAVMKRLGMEYAYSYQEHWQPKGKVVTFRLYQKNFREGDRSVYRGYWDASPFRCVEAGV